MATSRFLHLLHRWLIPAIFFTLGLLLSSFYFHFVVIHRTNGDSGILSARNNSKFRRAIRDTWLGGLQVNQRLLSRNFKVLAKFIVGDTPCTVPPELRHDPYTCQRKILRNSSDIHSVIQLKSDPEQVGRKDLNLYYSLGIRFIVNHPIVVSSLGIINLRQNYNESINLYLYDEISQQIVVHTILNHTNPGKLFHNFRYNDVGYFLLPKGFIGYVFAENITTMAQSKERSDWILDEGQDAINIFELKLYNNDMNGRPHSEDFISKKKLIDIGISFQYTIKVDSIETKYIEDQYKELLSKEQEVLDNELITFKDIVLVPHLDIYRTIADKILLFYDWSIKNVKFQLFMKVDDDCFVNIDAIVQAMDDLSLREKDKFWWGHFRVNWPVQRFGKWKELDYNSPIYPAFACGSGSIITADIVKWLANNRLWLKSYQGEDVSMGIWMSALAPFLIKDKNWKCFSTCDRKMYTSPEHQPEELVVLWKNFSLCGNPCGC